MEASIAITTDKGLRLGQLSCLEWVRAYWRAGWDSNPRFANPALLSFVYGAGAGVGAWYRKTADAIRTVGMRVQSTPKISRFLALPGSLSLFTAHAIITPIIPNTNDNKYQAPLTSS